MHIRTVGRVLFRRHVARAEEEHGDERARVAEHEVSHRFCVSAAAELVAISILMLRALSTAGDCWMNETELSVSVSGCLCEERKVMGYGLGGTYVSAKF